MPEAWKRFCPMPSHRGEVKSYDDYQTGGAGDSLRNYKQAPENAFPEMAFAGKSNVGKSSLINGLLNRKSLARTSSQPGKTQTINFYKVNGDLYLVDLPGYGYA